MENIQGGSLPAEAAEQAEAAGVEQTAEAVEGPARRAGLAGFLNSRAALLAVGALLVGAVFWYLQFSTASLCCGDYDAYYHFRWSRMLWESALAGNFPPSFDALPLTTLNPKDYVDHHFLFHVLQIPFTWFDDARSASWAVLLALLLAAPLVYRHALRLIGAGHTQFVSGAVSTMSGLVVVMALIQTRGGTLWKLAASAVIVAVIGLCGWLTTALMARGRARPVAALAALVDAVKRLCG